MYSISEVARSHEELRRLALIQRLHNQGMVSLADTALLADTPERTGRDVLTSTIATIRQRVDDLTAAQRLLEHLLSCPHPDPVRDCTYLRAELAETVAAAVENR